MSPLTSEQLQLALEKSGRAKVLVGTFLLTEENMAQALANQYAQISVRCGAAAWPKAAQLDANNVTSGADAHGF